MAKKTAPRQFMPTTRPTATTTPTSEALQDRRTELATQGLAHLLAALARAAVEGRKEGAR